VIGIIKKRHWFKLRLKPEAVDEHFDVIRFREGIDKMSDKLNKVPADVRVENLRIGGMHADLTGLPPLMIQVGTHEIHLDDARNFGEKARKSRVDVTLRIWKNMIHAFPLLSPMFPEAKQAMQEIGEYIRSRLLR
jgi:acetyl esterase/lipase